MAGISLIHQPHNTNIGYKLLRQELDQPKPSERVAILSNTEDIHTLKISVCTFQKKLKKNSYIVCNICSRENKQSTKTHAHCLIVKSCQWKKAVYSGSEIT